VKEGQLITEPKNMGLAKVAGSGVRMTAFPKFEVWSPHQHLW